MNQLELGKLQPQATEIEAVVLGTLMLESTAVGKYIYMLAPDMFYKPNHRLIFDAIELLHRKSEPVDILTVVQELIKMSKLEEVGGASYVTGLTNCVSHAGSLHGHILIISEKYMARQVIKIANDALQKAYDPSTDVFDLISSTENELLNISSPKAVKTRTLAQTLLDSKQSLLRRQEARMKGEIDGVPSGYADLDRITGGFQKGDLILLAARPSMGKTALSIQLALNATKKNIPVVFFSVEMNNEKLTDRILVGESDIDDGGYRLGNIKPYQMQRVDDAIKRLSPVSLYLDDTAKLNIAYMRAIIRNKKPKAVFVDYLQLMDSALGKRSTVQNREQEISYISRSLKAIAKDFGIPVIALSQLSREVEKRSNRRPQLSDLRESGSLEQDADLILFPWRPAYYGITQDENGESLEGWMELKIDKHRNGPTGKVLLKHNPTLTKFYDKEPEGQTQELF